MAQQELSGSRAEQIILPVCFPGITFRSSPLPIHHCGGRGGRGAGINMLIFTECIAGTKQGAGHLVNSSSSTFASVLTLLVDTQALLSPLGEPGAKECADLTIDTCHLLSDK